MDSIPFYMGLFPQWKIFIYLFNFHSSPRIILFRFSRMNPNYNIILFIVYLKRVFLLLFFKQLNVSVTLFNPLSVSQSRRAYSLRRTKTDINDAHYIAQLLVSDRSNPYHEQWYHISSLKSLTRTRFRLNKELQPLKKRYRRSVHILFPELSSFFCNLYTNSCLALLEALPSATALLIILFRW